MNRKRTYPGTEFLIGTVFICLVLPICADGQVSFERTYGGVARDHGHSVRQTSDGGFIVCGHTRSFGAGEQDLYLIKTDSLGDTMWTRTYGGINDDHGYCVEQVQDGGYIAVGTTHSFGVGSGDIYLIRTDSSGNLLWAKTYGGPDLDLGNCVRQTLDGGYIIAGYTQPQGGKDVYLIKTDALGDTLWTRIYSIYERDQCRSVQQTLDGGYILAGVTKMSPGSIPDGFLIKTDPWGDTLWTRVYRDPGVSQYANYVEQTPDGGYVMAGGAGGDFWLVKTNSSGDTLWTRRYGGSGYESGEFGQRTSDGGYIIGGWTTSFGAGEEDAYLVRTTPSGDLVWARTYGGINLDRFVSGQQTTDGGYIVTGLTASFGAGEDDVYLVKVKPDGAAGKDAGVVSLDLPGDTVFCDSIHAVMATVANYGDAVFPFHVIAAIDGYADTVQVAGLAPGSSVQVAFRNWQVPPADSSSYTMRVCTHVQGDVDTTNDCKSKTIFAYDPTGVEEELEPRPPILDFRLWQNEPNPFQGLTSIGYSLPLSCTVSLRVYDVAGRALETLVHGRQEAGVYQVRWDAKDRTSGIYFYRLEAGDFAETRKLILLK